MATDPQGEVTEILAEMNAGSEEARNRLFDVVRYELRRIAGGLMHRERPDHTLQPTELVSLTYIRLFGETPIRPQNRAHFFGAVSRAMQQLLVDHARKRGAEKHGGNLERVPLDAVLEWMRIELKIEMPDLDEALEALERRSRRQHAVVMRRFFGGLTHKEIADHLEVSESTVEKDWRAARAYLYTELKGEK